MTSIYDLLKNPEHQRAYRDDPEYRRLVERLKETELELWEATQAVVSESRN